MKLSLLLLLFIFTNLVQAQGRKPAVEDFVGIEIEEPAQIPPGTEVLFNFQKDMKDHQAGRNTAKGQATQSHWSAKAPNNASSLVGIFFILGLPALSLFLIYNRFRQRAETEGESNIAVLDKYRKERELKKNQEQEIKKAS